MMTKPGSKEQHPASFRDPSGFMYSQDGILFRQVNLDYREHYDRLTGSGLAGELVKAGLMIPFAEVNVPPALPESCYRILQPEKVDFISYPYEWSFSQLKDAALTTLKIQKLAFEHGLTLKDSSAYNIQFQSGHPILIDTLSFEVNREGEPWVAYRQFCQHFLAPLALMAGKDIRLSQLLRVFIDGIPLDLTSQLLPGISRLNFGLLTHLHLHAGAQKRYAAKPLPGTTTGQKMNRVSFLGLIDHLESTVRGLRWTATGTEWGDYYHSSQNYSNEAIAQKKLLIGTYLDRIKPRTAWDFGANTGFYSRVASERGIHTVAFDIDPSAVEQNYLAVKAGGEEHLLPLLLDLTNPSPSQGWAEEERDGLVQRSPVNVVMALALIHHLAIANNVPLPALASFFSHLSQYLLIEFVPKSDSQVQRLLASRKDIFPDYTVEGFEAAFGEVYTLLGCENIVDSSRILYLMERKSA
jgi:ribosomal protein L11 methylase PrmA